MTGLLTLFSTLLDGIEGISAQMKVEILDKYKLAVELYNKDQDLQKQVEQNDKEIDGKNTENSELFKNLLPASKMG